MKRVLIVAYFFPPIAASGSVRPRAFARHLPDNGWDPVVLAADPSSTAHLFGTDETLSTLLSDGIAVHRVPHRSVLQTAIDIRDGVRRAAGRQSATRHERAPSGPAPSVPRSWLSQCRDTVSTTKEAALRHLFLFPDLQASWFRPAVRHGARLLTRDPVDAIFATGSPWTSLLVGMTLARRFRLPFIADFRDPWTRNNYHHWYHPSLLARARAAEARICRQARWVVTNTDRLRAQFQADHPAMREKFVTITNGFDDPSPPMADAVATVDHRRRVELWHFGSLYKNRNPVALLNAIAALDAEGLIPPDALRVRFVGLWAVNDPVSERLASTLEARGLMTREPQISRDECVRQMRMAPALLAIQPDSPLQIPAKIYEYAAARRPILVIGGEGATADLVEKYHLGRYCPDRVDELKAIIQNLLRGRTVLPVPQHEDHSRFDYAQLTQRLANTLDVAAGHPVIGSALRIRPEVEPS